MPKLDKIFQASYIPTDHDILHARLRTTGISETIFDIGASSLRVYDTGGERSERKNWIHVFDDVQIVVFVVDLVAYEQCLIEDRNGNSVKESLGLWEAIVNSRWFENSGFVLVFSHHDMFEAKVQSRPTVKDHFPDFEGDPKSVAEICAFFEEKFLSLRRNFPHQIIKVLYTGFSDDVTELSRQVTRAIWQIRNDWVHSRT